MTAIDLAPARSPLPRLTLPAIPTASLKARVARAFGLPTVLPGRWYL